MSLTDTKLLNLPEGNKEFAALRAAFAEEQFATAFHAFLEDAAPNLELISTLLSPTPPPVDYGLRQRLRALMPLKKVLAIYLDLETRARVNEGSKFSPDKTRAYE